eukprot:TRINITY_DN9215_c0_g2_i1.p1 TRINITY_DN9215_c0_g2~~TRINITY_DN9215_c0_g2_i1.p1  ORF type:complete len:272 (+),score=59.10 TRINITY_DN9215_c0_g2_i1:346-1161(+)
MSEANLTGRIISTPELEQVLKIARKERNEVALLDYIVGGQLDESLGGYRERAEKSVQVEKCLTIDQRIKKAQWTKYEQNQLLKDLEERMLKYKRDVDEKMRINLAAEVSRVKESEVAAVRLEEASKHRAKMEEYRIELERIHSDKLSTLRRKELEFQDAFKARECELEAASNEHKGKMLKHMERIKIMEQELKQKAELSLKETRVEANRLKELQVEYEQKIKDVDSLKKKLDEQIHDKMEEYVVRMTVGSETNMRSKERQRRECFAKRNPY